MSLSNMMAGYYGCDGNILFEGVSSEDLVKYDTMNGPLTMVTEAMELINDAFMEGVYYPNDIVVSAAMEGYSSVMESESKKASLKEKIKAACGRLVELFRKLGNAIRAFFNNIANKIKNRTSAVADSIKRSKVDTLEYTGPKFTHLEDIKKIINECQPDDILGKVSEYKKTINGEFDKGSENVDFSKMREDTTAAILDFKKKYGVTGDEPGSTYVQLRAYFRDGCKEADSDIESKQKISASDAIKVLNAGASVYADLDNVSKKIESTYNKYADKCEKIVKSWEKKENEGAASPDSLQAWNIVSSAVTSCQSFITSLIGSWASAYASASSLWMKAAHDADKDYVKTNLDK